AETIIFIIRAGVIEMWDRLTPADIERAKAQAAALREETLNRHAEELRALDADEAEIESLNHLIARFTEMYMNSAAAGAVAGPAAPSTDDATANAANPGHSEPQPDVRPPLQIQPHVSPNFALPVRSLLRG